MYVNIVKAFERRDLPKSVVPIHYEITIKSDLLLVFEARESIMLKV